MTSNSNMNPAVECAICLLTLRKPIRNLSCGYSFCEECLVDLSRQSPSSYIKCPICEHKTQLSLQGVKGLPRNCIVENLIDQQELSSNSIGASISGQTEQRLNVTNDDLLRLKELVSIYKKEKKFEAAINILQIIINQVQSYRKIKPMIDLLDCLLETNQKQKAQTVCKDLTDVINSHNFTAFEELLCINFDVDLHRLAQAFISIDYETSILLNRCSYKLSKIFYEGKDKLKTLAFTSFVMTEISDKMKGVNKIDEFKDQLPFMEEILEEMQQIRCDDVKFKYLHIARCLQRLGYCCNAIKSYNRSIDIHKQAIDLMESIFGDEAKKFRVFGKCHHNLGVAYQLTDQLEEARIAYMNAKKIYETVEDWKDTEEKEKEISLANNNIHIVAGISAIS